MLSFSKTTPEKAIAIVTRLETKQVTAEAAVEKCSAEYANARLGVEEDVPGASEAAAKALKSLQKAKQELEDATVTLAGAKARHADAIRIQAEEELERNWSKCKELYRVREKHAEKIEALLAEVKTEFDALCNVGIELHTVAPVKESMSYSALSTVNLTVALRNHLYKLGFRWAIKNPFDVDVPTLSQRVAYGNSEIFTKEPGWKPLN